MKLFFNLILVFTFLSFNNLLAQQKVNVKGEVKNVKTGKIYLQKFNNKMFYKVDSTELVDGKFAFNTVVELPEMYGITLQPNKDNLYIFLDENETNVVIDTAAYNAKAVVEGSVLQNVFKQYKVTKTTTTISEFIKQNPKSLVSAYVLYKDWSYRLSPDEILENLSYLDKSLENTPYVKALNELVPVLRTVQSGNRIKEYVSTGVDGKEVRLTDYLGNYLLVSFWGSWCDGCEAENPNVVKAYNKFKDKGFDVFGIGIEFNKENWLLKIKTENLTWTQVSDLKFWNSEAIKFFGVREIPSNLLVDPNGVIIGRNLFGDDLLNKLEEIYSTKLTSK